MDLAGTVTDDLRDPVVFKEGLRESLRVLLQRFDEGDSMTEHKVLASRTMQGAAKHGRRAIRACLPDAVAKVIRRWVIPAVKRLVVLGGRRNNQTVASEARDTICHFTDPSPPRGAAHDVHRDGRVITTAPEITGDAAYCPICENVAASFLPTGARTQRMEAKCPTCGSVERHRLVWMFFKQRTNLFSDQLRMLHIAPEACFAQRLQQSENLDYLSADIESPRAMVRMDITSIDSPDDSFDVIYASHVLEHIEDDVRAMGELHRVLKPGGWAVLQVPIWGKATREDPTVTDPKDRERVFGQFDHVRMYGHDGEYERRLRSAGFVVSVERFVRSLTPLERRRNRLMESEDIYLCKKSA